MNEKQASTTNPDNIELRSEEIQDILTRPPHILVRAGISVICVVVFLLLVGSFFFKYPDIVQGEIVITTENPPVWMTANTTGKITELNCTDKSRVQQGQILAVIENPARTSDVLQVKEIMRQCVLSDSSLIFPPELLQTGYELGNIQNAYSAFLRSATDYTNFLTLNSIDKEKEALRLQINGRKRYSVELEKQLKLKGKELKIAQAGYEREKQLYEKGVNSRAEMDAAENALLSIHQSMQQFRISMASDRIEYGQLIESLSKLDIQYLQDKNRLLSVLKTAFGELLSSIENWEQIYLLISPIDGTVTFNSFWTKNQYVSAGNRILAIVPELPGKIIGKMQAQASGSGKIKTGQRINIKIQGYPYLEYGTLQGQVKTISLISNENIYSVEAELPQGLKTGTGKELYFTGELIGQAEIVTDDRSLFSRILSPLRYLLENHTR
jgi:HlyD family secretion protein